MVDKGLPDDNPIKTISGGEHFTAILNTKGELYVCGRNDRYLIIF